MILCSPLEAAEESPVNLAPNISAGKYLFQAAGGCGCHTDTKNSGAFLAGGRPIKTPFGTFYGTNITPDPETGIGNWSDEDFIRAMTQGLSPEAKHYFPVFPYTSFQRIKRNDLLALKAYLFSVPPVKQKNLPHDLILPFGGQYAMLFWKNFVWSPQPFISNSEQTASWNRGAYLAQAVAHCGECHTPRNLFGALKTKMHFAGSKEGPEGELAPNITPHKKTGIGGWSKVDISYFLQTGMKPDGDDAQGLMGEVIEFGYENLQEGDLDALAEYLLSLEPISNDLKPDTAENAETEEY
ncbi:MAG: cytochrome c [Proteobacteria bacterium]|nr:cytochrome c [Pseudomonadota bacterium]MBT5794279.1 cytochrome c [Deltaproteobacteria bacterium]